MDSRAVLQQRRPTRVSSVEIILMRRAPGALTYATALAAATTTSLLTPRASAFGLAIFSSKCLVITLVSGADARFPLARPIQQMTRATLSVRCGAPKASPLLTLVICGFSAYLSS